MPATARVRTAGARAAAIAAGFLILAGIGLLAFYRAGGRVSASGVTEPTPVAVKSVAVLPFVNVGADTANEYFADGMTDELTSALAKVNGLRVASRTSAFAYKGQKASDIRIIGKALNVDNVLEGTIRRSGQKMRITAQLTNANDGLAIWSESYERDVKDVFAVQDELARAITNALQVSFGGQQSFAHHGETKNVEAHDLYLRAEYLSNRFEEVPLRASIKLYEEAILKDPRYSRAWTGIANAWSRLADEWVAPAEALPRIEAALDRAVQIDSLDPEIYAQRAQLALWYNHDIPTARREFERTFRLDPAHVGYADFIQGYSVLLQIEGKRDSAIATIRHLVEADPVSVRALDIGADLLRRGDTVDGMQYCRRLLEISPEASCRVVAWVQRQQFDSAAQFFTARLNRPLDSRGVAPYATSLASVYAMMGRSAEARRELQIALTQSKGYIRQGQVARVWLGLNERDSAIVWLEKAERAKSFDILFLLTNPLWSALRDEQRFRALIQRAGLTPYLH